MSEQVATREHPPLRVELQLGRRLFELTRSPVSKEPLIQGLAQGVGELARELGVPAGVDIELAPMTGSGKADELRLRVNQIRCRASLGLSRRVFEYVSGRRLEARVTLADLLDELLSPGAAPSFASAVEFVVRVCVESIKQSASVLLGDAQLAEYRGALGQLGLELEVLELSAERLASLLTPVLELGLSIADHEAVAECLRAGLGEGHDDVALREELIVALRPDLIEIALPEAYLRELTESADTSQREALRMLREGLYYELGVWFPRFAFVIDESVRARCFVARINHLRSVPWLGLERDQLLVNDTTDRLTLLEVVGKPATNPANDVECATAPSTAAGLLEQAGLTTWPPFAYLVLALAADLRAQSHCFIDRASVERDLGRLGEAFPELVAVVRTRGRIELLVGTLRELSRDGLSIRNLRHILEAFVDFDHVAVDLATYILLDERLGTGTEVDDDWRQDPRNIADYVRKQSKAMLANKYGRGGTLVVYLLDPAIEAKITRARDAKQPLSEHDCDAVLAAVGRELGTLYAASTVVVLTTGDVRPWLRRVLEQEFPRLPVLSYGELPPTHNIQPIARITLG